MRRAVVLSGRPKEVDLRATSSCEESAFVRNDFHVSSGLPIYEFYYVVFYVVGAVREVLANWAMGF